VERAEVDGVQLEYQISGTGTGDPVVFIHGAFIADSFRPLLAESALAERYKLITYRRRGYGSTNASLGKTPVTAEQQSADCASLLRYLGVRRAHVVGHSFGGCVALQLALDAPELVRSLALLEPALFVGASAQAYRESLLRSTERYRREGANAVMEEFFRARWPHYSRGALEQAVPGAFEQASADAPTTFELDIGLTDWTFGKDLARCIYLPALVVLGGDSPKLNPRFEETYRQLLDWLPHAEGLVVPGATHLLQLESAEISATLARAMAEFFARDQVEGALLGQAGTE
jgi:pimeloyl-ACP methyl ester carboxylesterase